ncbi:putative helicase, superfamily II [Burkholderiales bacterium GJ-E10]|nr:putative helicase, superfamily II [Burkholderiales bacterium GJ-E10]
MTDRLDGRISLRVTPHGHLLIESDPTAVMLPEDVALRIHEAFARGTGPGLLQLAAGEAGATLPPALAFFRQFALRYIYSLCTVPDGTQAGADHPAVELQDSEIGEAIRSAPLIAGSEYITPDALRNWWNAIDEAARSEMRSRDCTIEAFLHAHNPVWNSVGRIHFNLAPNRKEDKGADAEPFAFVVTYTPKLLAQGRPQHVPLGQALQTVSGARQREQLLSLLGPVQRAGESCDWVKALLASGDLYRPTRWTAAQAYRLLQDSPKLERAGVIVRLHGLWSGPRPPRPKVSATIGSHAPSGLGRDALLDFQVGMTLGDETLTDAEIRSLLSGTESLVWLRGQWVEVDRDRLKPLLKRFSDIEALASRNGIGFFEASRMIADAGIGGSELSVDAEDAGWIGVEAGPWLAQRLAELRGTDGRALPYTPPPGLAAQLRPYQAAGVQWLQLLAQLGLGACLADDMGLGKTLQVIAFLLHGKPEARKPRRTKDAKATTRAALLIVPASLIANWVAEFRRFAPGLRILVAHPSATPAAEIRGLDQEEVGAYDAVITSYGTLARSPNLQAIAWRAVVVDEAQAIKNPGTKQARAVKAVSGSLRIALTGTPVENRLGDLWSIFDFINPGLLGTAREFSDFTARLARRDANPYGPLRALVRPYILRRMKTDRAIIADLPDKTEMVAYCPLTKPQAALYQQAVDGLSADLETAQGASRRGLILAYLTRFKQICNHPRHWLGGADWVKDESGKFARLAEICETIREKQEKVLVFTQYQEATAPLAAFLAEVFGRPALVLHGKTPIKARQDLVARFQDDELVNAFVISLRAGGVGLNLTAASHVIHFDRWWNPAVENQATDRAYRIGQKRNVLVHKLVCRGTIEERIDRMIAEKTALASDLLDSKEEIKLTELSNAELLDLVKLDLRSAALEA